MERAAAYDEYVQNCFGAPYIVGQHWFEYVDQPLGGRDLFRAYRVAATRLATLRAATASVSIVETANSIAFTQ